MTAARSGAVASAHPEKLWSEVEEYLAKTVVHEDPAARVAGEMAAAANLPPISVTASQGQFLAILVAASGARNLLEIGTLGGYSTIWLARAAGPKGKVITLEANPHHAEVARSNVERAGMGARVQIRSGKALDLLPALASEVRSGAPPFDFFFIDADKENNARYFEWAVKLGAPGAIIVVDNVVREGTVLDEKSADPNVRGTRAALERIGGEAAAVGTVLQLVGPKGHDGMAIVRLRD